MQSSEPRLTPSFNFLTKLPGMREQVCHTSAVSSTTKTVVALHLLKMEEFDWELCFRSFSNARFPKMKFPFRKCAITASHCCDDVRCGEGEMRDFSDEDMELDGSFFDSVESLRFGVDGVVSESAIAA